MEEIKLTHYSKGSGCGCKISPSILKDIIECSEAFPPDSRLWVGNETADDAAVMEWNGDEGLIATTDFFMPMVDDSYSFGKIAAANALSDVYAMGGSPMMALAILGWPIEKIPAAKAREVLEGARYICRMAGIPLAGGHSIESAEPIFGLAVNGHVSRKNLLRNNQARVGDVLYVTKPLGVGIVTAAKKRGQLQDTAHLDACISYMSTLNKFGESLASQLEVHAMTDITGFGFAGHLLEMCEGSNLTATVDFAALPVYPFLETYLSAHIYPDMTMKNYSFYASKMDQLSLQQLLVMCDPQTSGGLLIAVPEHSCAALEQRMNDFGLGAFARPVGVMKEQEDKYIRVVSPA
jgi:selenide, water dikinase